MQVEIAKKAGFCSGVKRAVNCLLEEAGQHGEGSTFGPIVHNEEVVEYLRKRKITAVSAPEEVKGTFLAIRTHGVTPEKITEIGKQGNFRVIDLTCPRVHHVQKIAINASEQGRTVIIFGDKNHPEVEGLIGWAGEGAVVISSLEELRELKFEKPSALIAQTTGSPEHYEAIKEHYKNIDPEGQIYDTLCPETELRQQEAVELAQRVEALVVVGSKSSANTKALYDSCRQLKPSCRVTNAEELDFSFLRQYRIVGVTAGASTPPWTIKEVVEKMENENKEVKNGEAQKEETPIEETEQIEEAQQEAAQETAPEAVTEEEEEDPGTAEEKEEPEEAQQEAAQETAQETAPEAVTEEEEEDPGTAEEKEEPEEAQQEAAQETAPEAVTEEEEQDMEQFDFADQLKVAQVGEQVSGKVARVTDEEVYVDIGAKTEAILPVNEVHLKEGQSLADLFGPEDDLEVTVLEVDEQEGKVVVSHKRLARDKRLKELEEALESQVILEGRVKQVVSAGIVVDLGSGIEGFMPGSLVDIRFIPDFNEFKDQDIRFKVLEYDREKGKLILTRRKVMEEESSKKKEATLNDLKVGSTITGTVKRLTDFGAFVDVGGIDGLVHISELSWERVKHPKEVLQVGDEIEVKILEVIPEKERISLSIRKTQPDPWTKAIADLEADQLVTGKVTRLVNFGAFIEIKPGVEGLVHISQLADYHVKHPSEVLSEGEEVEVKILEVKPKAKRISLSIKDASGVMVAPSSSESDDADNGNVTLGDVFGDLFDTKEFKEGQAADAEEQAPAEEDQDDSEPEGGRG